MTIEGMVRSRITSNVPSVGSRSYLGVLPETVTYPAIRIQTISSPRTLHFGGVDTFKESRIQLSVHSDDGSEILTALGEIEAAFNGWTTTSGGITVQFAHVADDRDLYEEETGLYGRAIDLMVATHT